MRTIPAAYNKGGSQYTLLARTATVATYEQRQDGRICGYEVCHIINRPNSSRNMGGTIVWSEAGEYLPSTEQWGSKAWTHGSPEAARARMESETAIISAKQ